MIGRRRFLGMSAGAGAALTLSPHLLRALQPLRADLIQRAIPSTGEKLPVIGLSFSNHATCSDHAALTEVLKTWAENGGRAFDSTHASIAAAEQFHATAATELGLQDRIFWSVRGTPGGTPAQAGTVSAKEYVDTLLARLKVPKVDLVMFGPNVDPAYHAAMQEEKRAGRVRYIGVQSINLAGQGAKLESVMRSEPIDFIGVEYDVGNRRAEETILPLAQERKLGVWAFFPLGNNAGASCGARSRNLFARVGDRPVPEWAAEFDARTWAQFFLKYVVSHPAITCTRVGTSRTSHMLDNIAGGVGRLPDEAMRRRMAEFIDALPPLPPLLANDAPGIALPVAVLDRYVGEYRAASGLVLIFRRDGDRLLVKDAASNQELALNARSETRLQDPRGPVIEFQMDAQGRVTGAIAEQPGAQGMQRIVLTRR